MDITGGGGPEKGPGGSFKKEGGQTKDSRSDLKNVHLQINPHLWGRKKQKTLRKTEKKYEKAFLTEDGKGTARVEKG